ncbi:uncharacterized protein [Amphiura filiformis]|uniref:uncharacterized protein isoform X2 n=1 Tax=Amphiura filiformis TaxID=82378 RepID=UPI003B21DA77
MALVTRELNQEHVGRMMQLEKDFPEIPREIIDTTLIKMNGDLGRARQELDVVSERYLFGAGEGVVSPIQTPSPTSPQSPIRYPLHPTVPGSPSRSRTPSNPSTPGTPPMMDPFTGRSSPRNASQYQQPKPGQFSPQHANFLSQLRVTMDRPPSRPSSRPSSGSNQDEQLNNGTNSASSSGTPNRTPSSTPTRDLPRPQFSSPSHSQSQPSGAFSIDDDFPTDFSLTPTPGPEPVDRRYRHMSPDSRYRAERSNHGGRSTPPPHDRSRRYTPPHSGQRTQMDWYTNVGDYPVQRWNGPEYSPRQRPISQGAYFDPRAPQQYQVHPSQQQQQQHFHNASMFHSQSVPNLQGQLFYQPQTSRNNQPHIVHARSNQNISLQGGQPLIPVDIHPEVVTSSHVIPPTPHSPPRPVTSKPPRPHSESYDPRARSESYDPRAQSESYDPTVSDHFIKDTTTSLLVFPTDSRTHDTSTRERPINEAWMHANATPPENKFYSLPHPKPKNADDEYTQALIRHQNARFQKLLQDLENERRKLEQYRTQVYDMETELAHKSIRRSPFPTAEEVNKLRDEKRQLQIDIECMTRQIEINKSQGLMGQNQHTNFYANMSTTGPSGPMPPKPQLEGHIVHPPPPLPPPPPSVEPDEGQQWSCNSCTLLNHPALDKCECCEMPRM